MLATVILGLLPLLLPVVGSCPSHGRLVGDGGGSRARTTALDHPPAFRGAMGTAGWLLGSARLGLLSIA